jgi:hypothetical protein
MGTGLENIDDAIDALPLGNLDAVTVPPNRTRDLIPADSCAAGRLRHVRS